MGNNQISINFMPTVISVIICSRQKAIPVRLQRSIAESIGVEHEIITIDNSDNSYSIFSAYNEGVRRSKGIILCFCHDDILFRSPGWGKRVHYYFQEDDSLGVLGVAGAHFLPSAPMYWSSSPFISEHNLNNDNGKQEEFFHDYFFRDEESVEAVAVDGLCFFMPKAAFEKVKFDEETYSGFHLYDMDICLQALTQGYKVKVCRNILIEHSWSEKGAANKKGYDVLEKNLSCFCEKWKANLPIVRGIQIPDYVIERINRLCIKAYDATLARRSRAYRLGRLILKPFSLLHR